MHACLYFFSACLWFSLAASLSNCGLFSYASSSSSASQYALVYKGFSLHQDDLLYWQLPAQFTGDKVTGNFGVDHRVNPFEFTKNPAPLVSSSLPIALQPSFSYSLLSSPSYPHSLCPLTLSHHPSKCLLTFLLLCSNSGNRSYKYYYTTLGFHLLGSLWFNI